MDELTAMLAGNLEIGVWDIVVLIVLSLPPVFVYFSKRVSGRRKVWWFIGTSVLSWLGYAAFLFFERKRQGGGEAPGS